MRKRSSKIVRVYARISRRLTGFHPLSIAFIIFSLLNISVYSLIALHPDLLESLWLSPSTPWGILTSAFTHAELGHLVSNLEGFALSVLLFIPVVSVHSPDIRRRWSRAFLWLVFLSGIGANLIEYPTTLVGPGSSSWGASGIVYGSLGVVLAGALLSLPGHLKTMTKRRSKKKRKLRFNRKSWRELRAIFVLSLLMAFLIAILTNTGRFLNVGPGIDVFAHGVGFLIGLWGGMAMFKSTDKRRQKR